MQVAKDLLTGESFNKIRINQKFANRRNQVKYNNLKATTKRRRKAKIDKPLDKNRNILKKLLGNQKELIRSRDWFLALEYDFGKYTHSVRIDNTPVPCVYEYRLIYLGENKYKIVRDEEY